MTGKYKPREKEPKKLSKMLKSLSSAKRNLLKRRLRKRLKPKKGSKGKKNAVNEKKSLPAESATNNQTRWSVSNCPSASTRCTLSV